MTISPELRPRVRLSTLKGQLSFWSALHFVSHTLRLTGHAREAVEFRNRAMLLNQTSEDQTALIALVSDYVDVVDDGPVHGSANSDDGTH